jgi:hypothetical protein
VRKKSNKKSHKILVGEKEDCKKYLETQIKFWWCGEKRTFWMQKMSPGLHWSGGIKKQFSDADFFIKINKTKEKEYSLLHDFGTYVVLLEK